MLVNGIVLREMSLPAVVEVFCRRGRMPESPRSHLCCVTALRRAGPRWETRKVES
jgi:hypothetical protein